MARGPGGGGGVGGEGEEEGEEEEEEEEEESGKRLTKRGPTKGVVGKNKENERFAGDPKKVPQRFPGEAPKKVQHCRLVVLYGSSTMAPGQHKKASSGSTAARKFLRKSPHGRKFH